MSQARTALFNELIAVADAVDGGADLLLDVLTTVGEQALPAVLERSTAIISTLWTRWLSEPGLGLRDKAIDDAARRLASSLQRHGIQLSGRELGIVRCWLLLLIDNLLRRRRNPSSMNDAPTIARLLLEVVDQRAVRTSTGSSQLPNLGSSLEHRCRAFYKHSLVTGRPFTRRQIRDVILRSDAPYRSTVPGSARLQHDEIASLLQMTPTELDLFISPSPPFTVLNAVAMATGFDPFQQGFGTPSSGTEGAAVPGAPAMMGEPPKRLKSKLQRRQPSIHITETMWTELEIRYREYLRKRRT